MKKKKWIAVAVVAAAAIIVIVCVTRFAGSTNSESGKAYVRAVSSINSADTSSANRFSGMVETQKTESVKLDSTMTFKECYVSQGDHVDAGDKLFAYDTQTIQIEIQQKQLEIEKLNSTISNDNAQISTLTAQMNKAAASEQTDFSSQISELQAEVAQSEYDIKVAQSEIDKKNKSIEAATVISPISGTVTQINDPDSLTDSTAYMTITADGDFRVKAKVSEQNITDIFEGEKVLLRSRIDDTKTWLGKISSIEKQATTDSQDSTVYYDSTANETSSSYVFYVELDITDDLMLGQHLTIEQYIGQDELEGIWITSGWIVNEDDKSYCWEASSVDGKLEKREVEFGEYNDSLDAYEITSGLSDTDFLAWPDADYHEGMSVSVKQSGSSDTTQTESSSYDLDTETLTQSVTE